MESGTRVPRWAPRVLRIAALFDVLGGVFLVVAPAALLSWAGSDPPLYPEVWQGLGLLFGVHGLGHALAARQPVRHWPTYLGTHQGMPESIDDIVQQITGK